MFGLFLIYTGIKMAFHKDDEVDPSHNPAIKLAKRFFPVAHGDHGASFFIRERGKTFITPMFLVLVVVETTDIIFALDSIPAIFAVTKDPFIVYTSNVFAILGLRALYFLLAGIMELFRYLKLGLSAVLVFVGVKMLLGHTQYKIPINAALLTIAGILTISIVASLIATAREKRLAEATPPHE